MEYLNINKFSPVIFTSGMFELKIEPFEYLDGRKPRLPRKSSKNYDLSKDINFYFHSVFTNLDTEATNCKFKVEIKVRNGLDRLGSADLDNYCKAILDGVTNTQKVWKDDRQVDEIKISRIYTKEICSSILLQIQIII